MKVSLVTQALLLALLRAACAMAPGAAMAAADTAAPLQQQTEPEELLLVSKVNGKAFDEAALVLKYPQAGLYVSVQDLLLWRLKPPLTAPRQYRDSDYYSLDTYEGLKYTLNLTQQTLTIMAPGQAFQFSNLAIPIHTEPVPTASHWGGFFNYDLVATSSSGTTQGSGDFEIGLFGAYGVGTMGVLMPQFNAATGPIRLDATWSLDQPQNRQSWRFGDVIDRPGAWGRAVRMGGIQWGSNFATQPGFITFPAQQAAGLATLPSTVDVYVNNVLTAQREVPSGPFAITNLPVMTGTGELRLVVRDLLGREQVVTQPFYSSAGLLTAGLHDYSYELGKLRQNFGVASSDYANWAAVGTHRLGLTDKFTGELHVELQSKVRDAGFTGLYLFPQWGMLNATLSASQTSGASAAAGATGSLAAIGFERQSQAISFGLHSQWTSPGFRQLGFTSDQLAPARQLSFNTGYATQGKGSFSASYLRQDERTKASVGITAIGYSADSKNYGTLSLSATSATGGAGSSRSLALLWSLRLGNNRSVSVTQNNGHSAAQGNTQATVATLQQSAPIGPGYGYMLQAQDTGAVRADLRYQNNIASFDAGWDHTATQDAMTAGVRGGVALLGGQAYLNRWISDSFGVARVAGFPNVRVYANNQLVGITDASGDALLPLLKPYESNQISIDARDLPMNAQVDALRVQAVPYLRSGVLAEFPVRAAYGALFRIRTEQNLPLPGGATVEIIDGKTRFPVANDGEVYVTGLSENNHMIARWKQQSCEFEVRFKPGDDPVPDLGEFICKGITP